MTAAFRHRGTEKTAAALRFSWAPHVMQAEHAGTIVLFDGSKYYTLPNETACDLWRLLAESRSADELVTRLYDQYDAPREVIAADVAAQLQRLFREGLVLRMTADGTPVSQRQRWWKLWKGRHR